MNFQIIPVAEASGLITLMKSINKVIVNPLIMLIFALAVVYFLYGVVKYLLSPENEEVRTASKSHMLWGIIGMFIMISVFGIMNLLLNTLQVPKSDIQIDNNGTYTVGNLQ
jgi:ABC-type Na+ efflux pump permease subunit